MSRTPAVNTMRLRYAGSCAVCGCQLEAGVTAHYLRVSRSVQCLSCGPEVGQSPRGAGERTEPGAVPPLPPSDHSSGGAAGGVELVQAALSRSGACDDCGRRIARGSEALAAPSGTALLCMDCVALETVHSVGVAGTGARREHGKRLAGHHTRVHAAHPKLGGLILALREDPAHVRAWATGAVGEEQFGRRLSAMAGDHLKVLHDRKLPRSSANVDHLAVTPEAVWVLDAKRYNGKVETRRHGLFTRRPPDLYVGGRNQTKLVDGAQRQVAVIESLLEPFAADRGLAAVPVRGALVFIGAEFGLFASPLHVDGVWVGWGKAIRKRLAEQTQGPLPAGDIAKLLARRLRQG